MKKLIIIPILLLAFYVKAQTRYVTYMDSVGQVHTSTTALPQIAISGYFSNLLNVPANVTNATPNTRTLTINGVTFDLTANRTWTTTVSAPTVLSKTGNYTVLSGDFVVPTLYVNFDCTSGNLTATLPTASSFTGYNVVITKTDGTSNTLTISGLGSDNVISVGKSSKTAVSNGTTWINN